MITAEGPFPLGQSGRSGGAPGPCIRATSAARKSSKVKFLSNVLNAALISFNKLRQTNSEKRHETEYGRALGSKAFHQERTE